ncbi:MAG: FHA domain-containing protein [Thermodesulfobacteriota bacterium]|nr:FHA domain-containing protein [Thermodesulfobacteriota bacterium]
MKQPPVIVVQLFHIKGPVPLSGKESGFYGASISIGRHPSCHLRFSADLTHISRQHAEIVREGNQFKLIDHSANGTFVNGKKVKEAFLKDGDVLMFGEVGPQVSFLTQMEEGLVEKEAPPAKPLREHEREIRMESAQAEPSLQPKHPPEEKSQPVSSVRPETPDISVQPAKAPLIIQYGPTIRSFKQLPITIGKSLKCEYPLDHPALSDQHAQVFFSQDQYWVKDLTGQKLVRINRQPVGFQAPLRSNDELALSPQGPLFRFFGEGRLGEIEEAPEEKPLESSEKTGAVAEKKSISSKFKKIFKS